MRMPASLYLSDETQLKTFWIRQDIRCTETRMTWLLCNEKKNRSPIDMFSRIRHSISDGQWSAPVATLHRALQPDRSRGNKRTVSVAQPNSLYFKHDLRRNGSHDIRPSLWDRRLANGTVQCAGSATEVNTHWMFQFARCPFYLLCQVFFGSFLWPG